ncbi:hypothetical protein [Micromonospora halophytica]|uniref:HprK-related kinase B n=1 Tax=Micromonospora halophytica TaxID=47864 RepID=A0A1C5I6F4_9ACTN|nr:hypothetical protein [Micromonospora halophytica]SCG54022.1 hypothetical protein GA0070560_108133 [Micromonospora halophytica]
MSNSLRVRARAHTGAVGLTAPADDLTGLTPLLRPFVDLTADDEAASCRPSVRVAREVPSGPGWRRVVAVSAYEPDRVLWVHDDRQAITVVGQAGDWRVQHLLRSVRHLLRWQAYAAGDLLLHGGLVTVGGRGIGFVGGKRSGKTSSILSALLAGGAAFISNDDLTVVEGPESGLLGYGSPRTVNIRTDSLLALAHSYPVLANLVADARHPTNAFEGRHRTVESINAGSDRLPGSLWVRVAELATTIGVDLRATAPVDVLVFPTFTDHGGPELSRLGREAAAGILAEHVERQGTRYDPFLADWFPHTDVARRARLIDRLLDTVPCYRLRQDMRRLPEATAVLLQEIDARAVPE